MDSPLRQLSALMQPFTGAGTVDEVAATVRFLVSDGAAYITGQVIGISGGLG